MARTRTIEDLQAAVIFYKNFLQLLSSKGLSYVPAFLNLIETETIIANRQHPFNIKVVWSPLKEQNDDTSTTY